MFNNAYHGEALLFIIIIIIIIIKSKVVWQQCLQLKSFNTAKNTMSIYTANY